MTKKKSSLEQQIKVETTVVEVPAELAPPAGKISLRAQVEKTGAKPRSKSYVIDLRIHSPASLGYMSVEGVDAAPALVRLAKVKGLDVIAVTDFYSGTFIDRVLEAAKDSTLTVIPGVVIRCGITECKDVILCCLFPENYGTQSVENFLRALKIPQSAFGDKKYLVAESFEQILATVEAHGGVALPSRMDKTPYRMTAVPALVERYGFRAFDLAYADSTKYFKQRWPKVKFHLFSFSNANALAQVGSRIAKVKMQTPGFMGIRELVARQEAGTAVARVR